LKSLRLYLTLKGDACAIFLPPEHRLPAGGVPLLGLSRAHYCESQFRRAQREAVRFNSWRCKSAKSMGFATAVLGASPIGHAMYQKIGFRDVCDIGVYEWSP
jgi:hypothetical protein